MGRLRKLERQEALVFLPNEHPFTQLLIIEGHKENGDFEWRTLSANLEDGSELKKNDRQPKGPQGKDVITAAVSLQNYFEFPTWLSYHSSG